jgi:hypothetical protein
MWWQDTVGIVRVLFLRFSSVTCLNSNGNAIASDVDMGMWAWAVQRYPRANGYAVADVLMGSYINNFYVQVLVRGHSERSKQANWKFCTLYTVFLAVRSVCRVLT